MAINSISGTYLDNKIAFLIPTASTLYSTELTIDGQYLLTAPSDRVVSLIVSGSTNYSTFNIYTASSGQVTFTIPHPGKVSLRSEHGTNTSILLTKLSNATDTFTGTLDSITSTGTYTLSGNGIVVLIGGGTAGTPGLPAPQATQSSGGPGGKGGDVRILQYQNFPGNIPVIVGAGGIVPGGAGGITYFDGYASDQYLCGPAGGGAGPNSAPGGGGSTNPAAPIINPIGTGMILEPGGGGGGLGGGGGGGGRGSAGGGGGGGGATGPTPNPALRGNLGGGGGGGGGYYSGSPGAGGQQTSPYSAPGAWSGGAGGAGGAGGVYVLRFNQPVS